VLLTVDLVPTVFPFRDEPVLTDALVRGFVPRLFMPDKELSDRGQEFARTIWAYDSGIESGAAIAPSMPGDLYHAGGTVTVALGRYVGAAARARRSVEGRSCRPAAASPSSCSSRRRSRRASSATSSTARRRCCSRSW
jgi:hypothetical protein